MSGPVEVTAGGGFEFGICPLMSSSMLIPEPVPGSMVSPGGPTQVAIRQVENLMPCFGEKCGMWSRDKNHCSIVCLSEISNGLKDLEASGGRGYLYTIAESLKKLVGLRAEKMHLDEERN